MNNPNTLAKLQKLGVNVSLKLKYSDSNGLTAGIIFK